MENKCEKGKSCIHCGSCYCQYVEEHKGLEKSVERLRNMARSAAKGREKYKEKLKEIKNFLELPEFYIYSKEYIRDRIEKKINEVLDGNN